ncbi:MAG: DUF2282 domain-containing protein [Pseudomonadota bacterium]|nr:DUF2282 domain-containing protein [Pseudomonadota bacterium]
MKKTGIFTAVAAAVALTSGVAFAQEMEECKVVRNGVNVIKESSADCKTADHTCAGKNAAGDKDAFIRVPKGQCDRINAGDVSGVSKAIQAKIIPISVRAY